MAVTSERDERYVGYWYRSGCFSTFRHDWVSGFEIAAVRDDRYALRRSMDWAVLPGQFTADDVRVTRRPVGKSAAGRVSRPIRSRPRGCAHHRGPIGSDQRFGRGRELSDGAPGRKLGGSTEGAIAFGTGKRVAEYFRSGAEPDLNRGASCSGRVSGGRPKPTPRVSRCGRATETCSGPGPLTLRWPNTTFGVSDSVGQVAREGTRAPAYRVIEDRSSASP
jgi:hypothetical protein